MLKKRGDGRVELRMETTGRTELVRWVRSWMPDVRVLAPKSLRDRIALKLEEGLRRNGGNTDMPDRVAEWIAPSAPTPPDMRVRIRRFRSD